MKGIRPRAERFKSLGSGAVRLRRLRVDENVPRSLVRAVGRRRDEAEVLQVGDGGAPEKGTADPDLLLWCGEAVRILVSLDRRSMVQHFADHLEAGHPCGGIVLIRRGAGLTSVADDLTLIIEATGPQEWTDRLIFLPLAGS